MWHLSEYTNWTIHSVSINIGLKCDMSSLTAAAVAGLSE